MPRSFLIKKHSAVAVSPKKRCASPDLAAAATCIPHPPSHTEIVMKRQNTVLPPCCPALPMSPLSRQDEVGSPGSPAGPLASPMRSGSPMESASPNRGPMTSPAGSPSASPSQRTPSPFSISAILSSPCSRSPPSRPLRWMPQPFYPTYAPFYAPVAEQPLMSPPSRNVSLSPPAGSESVPASSVPAASVPAASVPAPAVPVSPVPSSAIQTTTEAMDYTVTIKRDTPFDPRFVTEAPATSRRNEPPRFNCDGCGKTYATFSGLSKHKRFHCTSEIKKEFSCKFCDKTYSSLGALKMHIRTHTLPCKCPLCGKCFSRPWLLQGHVRTHTGEKPFRCSHCSRSFADRSNLRAHLQTHTDIKKYSCKTCAKTFSRMSLLVKHEDGGCPAAKILL